MMSNALITGGTGFIGRHLCADLLKDGWQIQILTRDAAGARRVLPNGVQAVESLGAASESQAVINLAGENLADGRWTQARKREMRKSRLRITRALVETMSSWQTQPQVLVSGSAVGYYGARGDDVLDEDEPAGDEFQSELCLAWEQAARRAESMGVRVCRIRTGIVLHAGEGALSKMTTPFRFGLGGDFGSGRQFMPWIHLRDEIRAIRFLMAHDECSGAYNLTAPQPVSNHQFGAALARALRRPKLGWVPAPALKLMLGEMAHLLLTGQRAIPSALEQAGFRFDFPEIQAALKDLLADRSDNAA